MSYCRITAGLVCLANFPNPTAKLKIALISTKKVSHTCQRILPSPTLKKAWKKQIFQIKVVSYGYQKVNKLLILKKYLLTLLRKKLNNFTIKNSSKLPLADLNNQCLNYEPKTLILLLIWRSFKYILICLWSIYSLKLV